MIFFVVGSIDDSFACEIKYNQAAIKEKKYSEFRDRYPQFDFDFVYKIPFEEEFLRKISKSSLMI